jgi:hypothetical protein
MTGQQVRCTNCGAPMSPQDDGRTFACLHCSARAQVAIDSAQIAAGMRLDLANMEAFLVQLGDALFHGFPDRTKIHRTGAVIAAIELDLDKDLFIAKRDVRGVVAVHKRMVRGVALKTVTHPLDRWVELLTRSIAAHVNTNARVAQVLARLRIE